MMLFTFSWTLASSHACKQSYKPQILSTKFSKFAAPLAYSPCMPNLPKPLARVHGVVNGSDAKSDERLCCTHRLINKRCKKTMKTFVGLSTSSTIFSWWFYLCSKAFTSFNLKLNCLLLLFFYNCFSAYPSSLIASQKSVCGSCRFLWIYRQSNKPWVFD